MNTNQDYAKFNGPSELRIVRTLPGPIERVWEYLTDPEKRSRWFCGGELEQRAGGKVVFHMVHKNIAPGEQPPAKYAQVQDPGVSFEGRVLKCEPPRLLAYTFGGDDSEVTIELTPQGSRVLLVLTHRVRGAEEENELTNYASGWHIHLDHLVAQLSGTPRPAFWSVHSRLVGEYEELRAAELKR